MDIATKMHPVYRCLHHLHGLGLSSDWSGIGIVLDSPVDLKDQIKNAITKSEQRLKEESKESPIIDNLVSEDLS